VDAHGGEAEADASVIGENLTPIESGALYDRTEGGEHNLLTMALGSGYKAIDTLTGTFHSDNYAPDGG
jgi:hypothetical protein